MQSKSTATTKYAFLDVRMNNRFMEQTMSISKFEDCTKYVRNYSSCFSRCNVTADTLWSMSRNAEIICEYTHKDGKKIIEQKTEAVSAEHYANVISSIGFFHDRVSKCYTPFGYIATEFRAKNPYDGSDYSRIYRITYKESEDRV